VDTSFGNDWTPQLLRLLSLRADRVLQRDPRRVYHADAVHFPRPTPLHRPYPQLLRRLRRDLLRAAAAAAAAAADVGWERPAEGAVVVVRRTERNNQHTHQHAVCAGGADPALRSAAAAASRIVVPAIVVAGTEIVRTGPPRVHAAWPLAFRRNDLEQSRRAARR
jgi:hypothetical protein